MRRVGGVLLAAVLMVLVGCGKSRGKDAHTPGGLGTPVAKGLSAELRLSPDAKFASYLLEAEKPRLDGIPPQMVVGELFVVPLSGGNARKVANGVTNVPGGWVFSPDSHWIVFLEGYNPASQSGTLKALSLTDPAAEPIQLGTSSTYMVVSPDSKSVAFISGGVLKLGPLGGTSFRDVAGEVSTVSFSPNGAELLFKRKVSAAAGLFVTSVEKAEAPRKLADQVGDFAVSPDGKNIAFNQRTTGSRGAYDLYLATVPKLEPVQLATEVGGFAFSPDGKYLARTTGFRGPGVYGDLFVGPANGGPATKLGEKVDKFEFSPDSSTIAYLELYDDTARAGVMGVTVLPDGKPKRVGNRVPNFTWGDDGKYLAFLSRFLKPVYSVDLMLYTAGADAAVKVHQGVFGYGLGPKNAYLMFRSNCIRDGRACDLFLADPAKPTEPAKKILEGIYSFKESKTGDRLLVSYARLDGTDYDVAVYNVKSGERKTLEQHVQIPAMFVSDDGAQVAYRVVAADRAGIYVASQTP